MNTFTTPVLLANCTQCHPELVQETSESEILHTYNYWRLQQLPMQTRTQMGRLAAGQLVAGHNLGHVTDRADLLDEAVLELNEIKNESARLLVDRVSDSTKWDGGVSFNESQGSRAGQISEHFLVDVIPVLQNEIPGGITLSFRALTHLGLQRIGKII